MSRRCKPGQRARIIVGWNTGKIVLVVRPYFGEEVAGGVWNEPIFPWVITSLGAPLRSMWSKSKKEAPPNMSLVLDDCDLEPLDDDEAGIEDARAIVKPIAKPLGKAVTP